MPEVANLEGTILMLETSAETPSADEVKRWVRALGERGVVSAVRAYRIWVRCSPAPWDRRGPRNSSQRRWVHRLRSLARAANVKSVSSTTMSAMISARATCDQNSAGVITPG